MEERTWTENQKRIKEMWPTAMWGESDNALREIFKRHLSGLMQNHLYAAIDEVKVNFSSHQPELKWFISAYDKIVERSRKTESGPSRSADKWWVDFERPSRHTGLPYKFSTDAPDLATANEIAKRTNGRVRNRSKNDEAQSPVHFLLAQDRAVVATAVAQLRERGMIGKGKLPPDISQWRQSTIGFVTYQVQTQQQEISA